MSLANHPIVSAVRAKYPAKICGCCFEENGLPYGHLRLGLSFAQRVANWEKGDAISNYYWSSGMCAGWDTARNGRDRIRVAAFDSLDKLRALWRFAGYCDELASSIRHTGWYLDADHPETDDTLRGIVAQLPARNGCAVFVAGYVDNMGGTASLYMDRAFVADDRSEGAADEAKREASLAADRIAEIVADREKDYRREENERIAAEEREADFEYA